MTEQEERDITEQQARTNALLAQAARHWQEVSYQPWLAIIAGMTAGAALFAAAFALIKLFGMGS